MIQEQEAQDLMNKFISLREKCTETNSEEDLKLFKRHESICIEKLSYLVHMKTFRYKAFNNYDDLVQEGLEALVKSMKNYNPKKGNIFWWAHKYIDTRISRSANLHTTIRFPLKVAKEFTPHKETIMPTLIEESNCPDKQLETCQSMSSLNFAMTKLTEEQKRIIELIYGLNNDKPMSINRVCHKLGINRAACIKTINTALSVMKDNFTI